MKPAAVWRMRSGVVSVIRASGFLIGTYLLVRIIMKVGMWGNQQEKLNYYRACT
jgi:hypothetical protein